MSTGNDIVAFAATDSARTCRQRFFSRIITQHEKKQFKRFPEHAGLSFSHFVWLLWSIKESAYKFGSRSNPQLVFAPLQIGVERLMTASPGGWIEGVVRFQDTRLYSRSWVNDLFLSTLVSEDPAFEDIRHGVHRIGSPDQATQSAMVRELALASLACHYPGAALRIDRTPGCPPVVLDGDQPLDIPISLAHHDCFVAYAYRLPGNSSADKKSAAN